MLKEEGKGKGMIFLKILFFHCGVARHRGNLKGFMKLERVFFINMLKGDGREFIFYVVQRIPQQSGYAESYSLPNRKIHEREKKKQSFL
jgi:hypothetical protein